MYGKYAMACFKYQAYMNGSQAITYEPSPHYRQLSLTLYGSITFTHLTLVWLSYHIYFKKQWGNPYG